MINFFRKTRKQLADDNKPIKYFRYAIGEIMLVVVGILIALSINNWNENRQLKTKELKVLKEIRDNLNSNKEKIELKRINVGKQKNKITAILNLMDNKIELPNDTLYYYLEVVRRLDRFEYTDAAYESLKTIGFDIIENDSIRLAIIDLYSNYYETTKSLINSNDINSGEALNKTFELCCPSIDGNIVPTDLDAFLKDRIFYNKLTLRYDWRHYVEFLMRRALNQTNNVIALIEHELESK